MKIIEFKDQIYPAFQAEGFAAQFAFPFAQKVCLGKGVDIGCNRPEWAFPGAIPVDITINDEYHAFHLPKELDYIFSSHCLEHLPNWVEALDYWISELKPGGVLFLYLPNMDEQHYWRPWNNRKHIHYLTPKIVYNYLNSREDFEHFFVSDGDLNDSFSVIYCKYEGND
jgi:SAM-dependent methyltransferase